MELLIFLAIVCYATKIGAEDLLFAVRGKPSPRQAARLARAQSRSSQRGGALGYLSDLWADAWSDASRRHHQRHERRQSRPPKTRRPAGPARTYMRNRASDTRTAMSRRWAAGWERAEARRQRRHDQSATAVPAVAPAPMVSTDTTAPSRQDASDDATDNAIGDDDHQTPEAEPSGTATPAHPATEGEDMSTPNGEVTGLRSAISYAEELVDQLDETVTALETLAASLRSGGTGENTIGKFTEAGEHLGAASAQMGAAAVELTQHLPVTEAYEATGNEAGEKDFVTAD